MREKKSNGTVIATLQYIGPLRAFDLSIALYIMVCCCLSSEPTPDKNGRIKTYQTDSKFQTGMCHAPCAGGCCTCIWWAELNSASVIKDNDVFIWSFNQTLGVLDRRFRWLVELLRYWQNITTKVASNCVFLPHAVWLLIVLLAKEGLGGRHDQVQMLP